MSAPEPGLLGYTAAMASWWSKVKGWFSQEPAAPVPKSEPARWLSVDDPANPFDVPILDLMVTQTVIATSQDPAAASLSVSWSHSLGTELESSHLLERPAVSCALSFPAAEYLPDGLLYAPPEMDQKWVIAWREGRIIVARSWTGQVEAIAEAKHDGTALHVTELRLAELTPLATENPVEVFDWLIRCHALQQKLPYPLDEPSCVMFEAVPLFSFSYFGNVIFCAAKGWAPSAPQRPLRSNGRVMQAMRSRDLEAVVRAVEEGEAVDSPGTFEGYTALHIAIVQGDLTAIQRLLELGADVNRRADRGMFALGIAIVHTVDLAVLDALEAAGADLAATNDDGFGALHAAAEVGHAAAVGWLVDRGADLELRTQKGHPPLHIACALGNIEAAQVLKERGADMNATNLDGQSALDVARAEGKDEIVRWLSAI